MFDRIEITPAYQVVCDAIQREILSARLTPGQQLPTETELAKQFGLTRHTVREGLRILEEGGLVRREAGRRLYVATPSHLDIAPRAVRTLLLQRVTYRDLWEVSSDMELLSLRLALPRFTPDRVEELENNVLEMEQALARGQSIVAIDVEFHSIIARATGNSVLLLAREPISTLFYPATETLLRHPKTAKISPGRLLEAHRRVADAVKAGDAPTALLWMERHMYDIKRGFDYSGLDIDAVVEPPVT